MAGSGGEIRIAPHPRVHTMRQSLLPRWWRHPILRLRLRRYERARRRWLEDLTAPHRALIERVEREQEEAMLYGVPVRIDPSLKPGEMKWDTRGG